ncbi:MAG TPA: PEP-CTERM sorting domain-containing protein [Candidatus Acidoferrum sp.]|nr:PEP-CTERM sorting domain-containing protein [Candidatus Acidoferrum sp.]
MCVRKIKAKLFVPACAAVMLFGAALTFASPSRFSAAKLPATSIVNANPIKSDSAAQAPAPGTLLLFGMGLVLTGTALRRKEGKVE